MLNCLSLLMVDCWLFTSQSIFSYLNSTIFLQLMSGKTLTVLTLHNHLCLSYLNSASNVFTMLWEGVLCPLVAYMSLWTPLIEPLRWAKGQCFSDSAGLQLPITQIRNTRNLLTFCIITQVVELNVLLTGTVELVSSYFRPKTYQSHLVFLEGESGWSVWIKFEKKC